MARKKSTEDLESEARRLRSEADTWNGSEVSHQREEAYEYYHGELYGDERSGRSDVVTREVYDAVEWTKAGLMGVFTSADKVVEFTPQGPEDVELAKQETDYVNYVFMRKNPGFKILYDWIHDGLLQKNGIVKWWWDDNVETGTETYRNISLEEATMFSNEHPDMTLDSFEYTEEDVNGIMIEGTEAVFTVRKSRPQARVAVLPSDEFIISRDARSINDASYRAHRKFVTRSEVLEMGFTEKQLADITFSDNDGGDNPEYNARHEHDQTNDYGSSGSGDDSQKKAWLYEEYFRSDIDGSGIATLIQVFSIDNKILEWSPAEEIPFASIAPLALPHKHHGLSLHDILRDIQRIKSSLVRAMLDNAQYMNHSRFAVVEGQANINDLLDSRPGGIVRMKMQGAVQEMRGTQLDPNSFGLLDYLDGMSEARSGVSKTSQGLNKDALRSNVAASTISMTMTAAQQKREMMARIIAETGFKDLFVGLHGLIKRNAKEADYVRLRGQFVKVDPTAWRDRADMVATVGLGNGNKDAQLQSYLSQTQVMQMLGQAFPQLISPQNAYEWGLKGFELHGYKTGEMFLTDPSTVPPPEPEPDIEMIKVQAKQQSDQMKVQADMAKAQEIARHNQAMEEIAEGELVRKTMKDEEDIALDRMELRLEAEQGRPVGIGDNR